MKPVIDVHGHVFRGKDIPLKGFLLSRHYPEWYIRLPAPLLFAVIARCIRQEGVQQKGLLCGWVLELVYKYMGQGYRRWGEVLALPEVAQIAQRMVDTFAKDGIELYVPLMIDYEYWFKSTPEPSIAEQIDTIYRDIVLPYKGTIHPFVPFDPARELAHRAKLPSPDHPDGGPPEKYSSLALVQDAIRNKGFIGVKVYNTMGYRPLGNAAVDEKRREIFRRNGMERYVRFTGEEFDAVLSELYAYCVQEQVPITAHCVSNGVEAYPGASYDFASPSYWRAVLDRFPDLHLNLAHFGWSEADGYHPRERWPLIRKALRILGQEPARPPYTARHLPGGPAAPVTWVGEICNMLERYPHLYADVSHHGVTEDKDAQKYVASYRAMCRDFPGVIQRKLLFGIDWHVIARADHYEAFKDRYLRVLGEEGLFSAEEIAEFLGGNALRFLGLLPLRTRHGAGWTQNRVRLQRFYESSKIDAPGWFTATA